MQHYSCMVDLLGRSGCLNEACDFINKMPIEPDAAVWGSLLSACRVHTNIELGELAAKRLFELVPKDAAPYVLLSLSNIYSAAGRWDGIEKIRKLMEDRGITKKPGWSWIVVAKQVHAFVVGDRSNPQTKEYLECWKYHLGRRRHQGMPPFQDMMQRKEQGLGHHREKLAIVFQLISTMSQTAI